MPLTDEQQAFVDHLPGAFVEACPGSGKTQTIVARLARIAPSLPRRRGLAVLSFTNSAIEEFISRCHAMTLDNILRHPGFIGTFDAFLRRFFLTGGGIEGIPNRPIIVDSWDTLGIDVRLRGQDAFRGDGVSLDLFDAESGHIDPVSIRHAGLRAHVEAHIRMYELSAARRRHALRQNGYLSASDVRIEVIRRLQLANWSAALGRALAARFQEVIVDESQDCDPLDCRIIRWLRDRGVTVSVVADPDQSIYGFRHGDRAELRAISDLYDAHDRLRFTGNFRSSPAVCSVAATLRDRIAPDASLGETADIVEPTHILAYQGNLVSRNIGRQFADLLVPIGVSRKDSIILAHSRRNALRACGSEAAEDAGHSNVAEMARAVGEYWSGSLSNRARESALRTVERTILKLMGQIDDAELPSSAAERRGLNARWLRRTALELISCLPRDCANTNEARETWIGTLRERVRGLGLTYRDGISERQFFPIRADADWHRLLVAGDALETRCATIHEAKGKQYEAVCVVIPPDMREPRHTQHLLDCWQDRRDDEAKRVIYVGITRAMKLAAIAIPTLHRDRLIGILQAANTNFRVHDI